MCRTNVHESGIIINVAEESDTFDSIFIYISQNISSWADCNVLWDLTRFDFQAINSSSIHNFIQDGTLLTDVRSGLKTAIVVNSELGFGMMRMLQMIAEGIWKFEIGVFRNSDQALDWLTDESI